jgi:assimilatory nitrate reductase catalytic subunit
MLQGVFPFHGRGLDQPFLLHESLVSTVPPGKSAHLLYFRAGNSTDQLIYLIFTRDGVPMRYFPVGAKSDSHVPLAVIEDLMAGTRIEVQVAAPEGTRGWVVVDVGMVEE